MPNNASAFAVSRRGNGMSVPVGGGYPAGGHAAAYVPVTNRVNFGWITESWQLFMAHAGIWVAATLALIGPSVILGVGFYVYFLMSMFPRGFPPPAPAPGVPPSPPPMPPMFAAGNIGKILVLELGVGLIFAVYSAFLYGGMFRMAVRQLRGLPPTYRDIFAGGPLFGRMLGAMFLLGFGAYGLEAICVGPGYAMLFLHANPMAAVIAIVLGFLLVFCLWPVLTGLLLPAFALMADGVPVIPALRRSVRAMKGNWLGAAGFVLVLGLLVYASELPCFLGLLATVPMIFLICALAYRDMAGMTGIPPPPAPGYLPAAPGVWPPPPGQSPYGQPPPPPAPGGWPPPQ
jgi:hypothetical protein